MIQTVGWKDLAFHQPEVGRNVCPFGFTDDDGMTDWVQTVFVGPGVEGGEIEVMDLFSFLDHVTQFDGIGASTKDLAGSFQEEYIRFTVGHEFCLEIKDVVGILTLVPGVKLSGSVGGHALGIIVFLVG